MKLKEFFKNVFSKIGGIFKKIKIRTSKSGREMEIMKKLENLISNFESILPNRQDYTETEVRKDFIEPLLELLGWDIRNEKGLNPRLREVRAENYISETGKPDYTFTLSGINKFFLEAKKLTINIETNNSEARKSAFQARRYGWSANHPIVLLSNFEYILIYDSTKVPSSSDDAKVCLLKSYHYSQYKSKWNELIKYISKKSIYSGKWNEILEKLIKDISKHPEQKIDKFFLDKINNWRIDLANMIYRKKPRFTIEEINELSQDFIIQIIFLRYCEDKNIHKFHRLQEIIKDPKKLQTELTTIFKEADKKYNAGLFDGTYVIFNINEKVILEIIEHLYYPKSPYVFNVIEANLFGYIYESFLTHKLVIEGKAIKLNLRIDLENRDVVPTPIEIVKYMVIRTISELCENRSPSEILKLRIADIACGSGIFLVEILDYLIHYLIEWYSLNDPKKLIPAEYGNFKLQFKEKKALLENCIYGIDIDTNAAQIAKFNLCIKILEDETEPTIGDQYNILPILEKNILAGNSLVDFNHIRALKISNEVKRKIFPLNWEFSYNTEKFDLIIGNPPYMSIIDMKKYLPAQEIKVYKDKYETSYRQFDKYFLFLERALNKIKENGIICLIIPNKFSNIKSGEKLRELLISYYISEFIDFGSIQLFGKKRTVYNSIIIVKNQKKGDFTLQKVEDIQIWWAKPSQVKRNTFDPLTTSKILTKSPWILLTEPREAELFIILHKNSNYLCEVATIFNGIQTSAERPIPIYWFENKEIIRKTTDNIYIKRANKEYGIEKNILKPFFKPTSKKEKGSRTYDYILPSKWIIFPYDDNGDIYPIDIMKNDYPETWRYLKDNYIRLVPKQLDTRGIRDVPHATKDTWYHYGRDQAISIFANDPPIIKLIVKVLAKEDRMYLYDENGMLIASGGTAGYCAISKLEDSYELEFIQAILNHPAIEWLISELGSAFEGKFTSRGTFVLERIPIKKVNQTDEDYKKIVESSQKIYDINKKLKNHLDRHTKINLENEKKDLMNNIQDLITEMYNISDYKDIWGKYEIKT